MSRPIKIIVLVLAVVAVLAAVTGIAYWTAQYDPDAPNPGLFVDGKKVETPSAMFTVGEYDVPFSVYRHYFLLYKSFFEDAYPEGFYDEDPDGDRLYTLKQAVEMQLTATYAWQAIANQMDVALSEEDLAEIDATLAEQKETFGAGFEQHLTEMFYLDEANYLEVTRLQKLMEKASGEYRSQLEAESGEAWGEEADKLYTEGLLRAKHILITYDPAAEDPEAAKAEALKKAEEIMADIRAAEEGGEDLEAAFSAAMTQYSEDPGLETEPDGYVFGPGEMVDVFYDTTLSLQEGEMAAEPVLNETHGGYHIIMRLPLTEEFLPQEEIDANRTQAIAEKTDAALTEKQQEMLDSLTVTYPDFYDALTAESIR